MIELYEIDDNSQGDLSKELVNAPLEYTYVSTKIPMFSFYTIHFVPVYMENNMDAEYHDFATWINNSF